MLKLSKRNFKTIAPIVLSCFSVWRMDAKESTETATENEPNLIYILVDQMRFNALSCMGNKIISTPNIDRLAAEGVIFTRTYSQCPVSVPARSCIMTGNSLCNTGVLGNKFAYESAGELTGNEPIFSTKTYDEVLSENGYKCEYYGKWHSPERKAYVYLNRPVTCSGKSSDPVLGAGLKTAYINWWKAELGITVPPDFQTGAIIDESKSLYYMPDPIDARYADPTIDTGEGLTFGNLLIDSAHTTPSFATVNTISAIERNQSERFSITCSFGPPHPPFVVAKPYYGTLKEASMPIPANFFVNSASSPYYNTNERYSPYFISESGNKKMKFLQDPVYIGYFTARYYEMVKEIDVKVGEILDKIDQLGLTDKTMVVFCSDHGEMLGSHGMNSKTVFYDESARVPLIIRYPAKIPAGKRIQIPVNLIDIRPTIEDYLNMPTADVDGKSLRPFIEGTNNKNETNFAVSEWNSTTVPAFMVRTERFKLMMGQTTDAKSMDALYDLQVDSLEQINILKKTNITSEDKNNAEYLKVLLVGWLKKVGSPYYSCVKARSVGRLFSTYALYQHDVAKIHLPGITELTGLPLGISYRILPSDTLEISVDNTPTCILNLNAIIYGTETTLKFEILSAFDFTSSISQTRVSEEFPLLVSCNGNTLTIKIKTEIPMNAIAQLYLLDGELINESGFQNNIISFSTKKFAKGLYLIKVRQNGNVIMSKFLIR